MNGREQLKRARAGAAAISRQDATALASPYFLRGFRLSRWLQINNRKDRRGGRSSGRRGGVL